MLWCCHPVASAISAKVAPCRCRSCAISEPIFVALAFFGAPLAGALGSAFRAEFEALRLGRAKASFKLVDFFECVLFMSDLLGGANRREVSNASFVAQSKWVLSNVIAQYRLRRSYVDSTPLDFTTIGFWPRKSGKNRNNVAQRVKTPLLPRPAERTAWSYRHPAVLHFRTRDSILAEWREKRTQCGHEAKSPLVGTGRGLGKLLMVLLYFGCGNRV